MPTSIPIHYVKQKQTKRYLMQYTVYIYIYIYIATTVVASLWDMFAKAVSGPCTG